MNTTLINILISTVTAIPIGLSINNYIHRNTITKHKIKKELNLIFKQNNIMSKIGKLPTISDIKISHYGFSCCIDTKRICSHQIIEQLTSTIKTYFHAIDLEYTYNKKSYITVLTSQVENINYSYMELNEYTLLCGHTRIGEPITINMLKTPHVGLVGTSTSGKSKCVELMLNNIRNADISLVNTFSDDFKGITGNRINGSTKIIEYLRTLTQVKTKLNRPLYVVIDEYNVLNNIKGIDKIIQDLLSQARHFNIYVICIMQIGNKEDCKFKNLFNTRIAFRTLEQPTLSAFLGITGNLEILNDREFYMTSTKLFRGKTYNLIS